MHPSATVTTRPATSTWDGASVGRSYGVHGVKDTASASMASAARLMDHVPALLVTVGNSAGSHVLLDSMVKTAETGEEKKKSQTANLPCPRNRKHAVLQMLIGHFPCLYCAKCFCN